MNAGGVGALVDFERDARECTPARNDDARHISAFSETLACRGRVEGHPPLGHALEKRRRTTSRPWSLGQIGRHSADHAKAVRCNILPKLLDVYLNRESSDDLKTKAKRALKSIIRSVLPALEPLLHHEAPQNILKYVCGQFAKIRRRTLARSASSLRTAALPRCRRSAPSPLQAG